MPDKKPITTIQTHNYLKPKAQYSPPEQRKVELFARIRKSSEYYHQGLDHNNTPCIFKIETILADFLCFRLNSNNYSIQDLAFYVKDTKGQFIPLAGGVSK